MTTASVIRQIESLFAGGSVAGMTDRELVECFNAGRDARDQAAFSAIVSRHGPMVLDICAQILGDQNDAEDAFQAVFLVLARKARSLGNPDLLANWLYGVALRTARRARLQNRRRRKNAGAAMERLSHLGTSVLIDHSAPPPDQSVLAREQAEILYREIDRLPGPFRLAVVLCYFEGLTLDEAAARLRCPSGTMRSRLARACDKLRRGMTRRGITLSVAAIASALTSRSASACVSSPVCEMTARAAIQFTAGRVTEGALSASAIELADEVQRAMLVNKLRVVAFALLLLGPVVAGAGLVAQAKTRQAGKPDLHSSTAKVEDNATPGPGRMFVTGHVLDPDGKPVSGASVMVYARPTRFGTIAPLDRLYAKEFGRTVSGTSGRFRVDMPRLASSRHDGFGAVALAPGYGAGWVIGLDPDADQPTSDIKLRPERVIHGRLFDVQGQPARDVKVSVTAIRSAALAPGGPRETLDGPSFVWTHPDLMPGWPSPAITAADGRFTLHGVGPALRVQLSVLDPRFASQVIEVNTDTDSTAQPLSFALQPAKTLTGCVTYADTGMPAPRAQVVLLGIDEVRIGASAHPIVTTADAEGRFRMNAGSGDACFVFAFRPDAQPYLSNRQRIDWPKGAVTHSADLALPRGVSLRGSVTDEGSGRPVSGAMVSWWLQGPANANEPRVSSPVETAADGSFALVVLPRAGYLIVKGPGDDYVLHELDHGLLLNGQKGRERVYAHAFVPWAPNEGGDRRAEQEVKVVLRPGLTVKGRVVGPDGQPVVNAWIISRLNLIDRTDVYKVWSGNQHGTARNGEFDLHGLEPGSDIPVSFFEPRRKLGATVRFSGKLAGGEPVVVRLEPCATASARLVGSDGKPLGGIAPPVSILMIVTAGAVSSIEARKNGAVLADQVMMRAIDPINYAARLTSDANGRVTFPALIPGATYRITDRTTARSPTGAQLLREFTLKAGEMLDLGDILIEKPASP
jgi:RNA polymerase sigma factor (sigma-70 family)